MRNIWQELALLFAGALASIIGGAIFYLPSLKEDIPFLLLALFVATFLLIIYGSGASTKMYHQYNIWVRKRNIKIGILSDNKWRGNDSSISSWTNVSPEEWRELIEKQAEKNKLRIKVGLVNTNKNFDSYSLVLNPYGGVYPERNLNNSETLGKIFNYVSEGGLFVNIADIPGYWAYNSLLDRRIDATPPIYTFRSDNNGDISITPQRLFELTPFMERLKLRTYNMQPVPSIFNWNIEFESDFTYLSTSSTISEIKVHRVVVVEKNVYTIIKAKKIQALEEEMSVTPLFFANYGNGKFLISFVFQNFAGNESIKYMIIDVIMNEFVD